MPEPTLTIVLPAYNEEARLDPALDELFGYLHRRGELGRDGRTGAAHLPHAVHVLVVDDGSTDGTAALVRARPELAAGELELLAVPHGGKGAAVRAGMLHADGDLLVFADADMATPPDELVPLVEALGHRRRRLRLADPAGRLGHAQVAARLAPGAGQDVPPAGLACGWSARSRTRSAGSRASGARSPATCSRARR